MVRAVPRIRSLGQKKKRLRQAVLLWKQSRREFINLENYLLLYIRTPNKDYAKRMQILKSARWPGRGRVIGGIKRRLKEKWKNRGWSNSLLFWAISLLKRFLESIVFN
jgi:hypothetical protein